MLAAYTGHIKERHLPGRSTERYGTDTQESYEKYLASTDIESIQPKYRVDGNWKYSFNSLGYRGPEFDCHAELKVFAVGCSLTFGTGIKWEQTWSYLFTQKLRNFLRKKSACLMNFSTGAASNDYIARTALKQCQNVSPDLLIVRFTHINRKELLQERRVCAFGPWSAEVDDMHLSFLRWYTHRQGALETVKNILLLQFYCQKNNIPYLFFLIEYEMVFSEKNRQDPFIGPLIALLDERFIVSGELHRVDRGRDNMHPGPITNEAVADQSFETYKERLYDRSDEKPMLSSCP